MKRKLKILGVMTGIAAVSMCFAACSLIGSGDETGGDGSDDISGGAVQITFAAGDGVFADNEKNIVLNPNGNGKVNIKKTPKYDGHAFVGWFDGNTEYDPEASYSTSCTFTAKYVSGDTEKVYSALFDENSTVSIDIDMSDAEWKKLDNDYTVFKDKNSKSPIYRMANSVTIGIDDGDGMLYYYYEEVGVRMKGNTSRRKFYGEDGFYNNIHMKLSFKQTFDDVDDGYKTSELKHWEDLNARAARKNRKFGGMEKIDIKYNSTGENVKGKCEKIIKKFFNGKKSDIIAK